jgi:hypothetical protein
VNSRELDSVQISSRSSRSSRSHTLYGNELQKALPSRYSRGRASVIAFPVSDWERDKEIKQIPATLEDYRDSFFNLVAGSGFEPLTFGL